MTDTQALEEFDLVERNDALRFAARTRINLERIEELTLSGERLHPITQLINSLLGLLVFLRERNYLDQTQNVKLSTLSAAGWPVWVSTIGRPRTLRDLLRHLRNSVAHGGIQFNSDSTAAHDVKITFTDRNPETRAATWQATIAADTLRAFVLRIVDDVEQRIG